jgi:TonB family protein
MPGHALASIPIPDRLEPLVPPAAPPARRERWMSSAELLLALLLNLVFLFALFYRPELVAPPQRKEPPAISVELVPQPKAQPPKPKEQPKPQQQPKPEEKKPEEPKPEEKKPEQKKPMERRESGGDPKLKQGAVPKVEEKTKEPPEKEVKKPKPDAPKQPAADLPDWAKKLAQGYDLPKQKDSAPTKARGSNAKTYRSDMTGEGGGDAYLNAMRDQVNAHVVYPPSAGGATGAATYGLVVDRSGALRSIRLLVSSGRRDLDLAAGEAIMRSAPFRPLPPDYDDMVSITAQVPVLPR